MAGIRANLGRATAYLRTVIEPLRQSQKAWAISLANYPHAVALQPEGALRPSPAEIDFRLPLPSGVNYERQSKENDKYRAQCDTQEQYRPLHSIKPQNSDFGCPAVRHLSPPG